VKPKSAPQKIDFEGELHTRGAYFHAFHTNGQIGHTRVGPKKLRWPRAPRSLNPSLLVEYEHWNTESVRLDWLEHNPVGKIESC